MIFDVAQRKAGFTLIEIMIVIAIIAILAGIVVPNFMQARAEARIEACKKNIITIANALNAAMIRCNTLADLCANMWTVTSSGRDYGTNTAISTITAFDYLLENDYLSRKPICPFSSKTYTNGVSSDYKISIDREHCLIYCSGGGGHRSGNGRLGLRYVVVPDPTSESLNQCGWYIEHLES